MIYEIATKRKTAGQSLMFDLLDDQRNAYSGYGSSSFRVKVQKDGGSFVAGQGVIGPIGGSSALYAYNPTADEMDAAIVVVQVTFWMIGAMDGTGFEQPTFICRNVLKDTSPVLHVTPIVSAPVLTTSVSQVVLAVAPVNPPLFGQRFTVPAKQAVADIVSYDPPTKVLTLSKPGTIRDYQTQAALGAISGHPPAGFVISTLDPMGIFASLVANDIGVIEDQGNMIS